ncbi:uncharacterized protein LOC101855019 isoform X2 [Aplysia californica]|uniref:Uncharacterized protein LOC101855019 isoform X2 n=1 Tax=Aplysia californica TaxID=6500 RepID=A0ABM1VT39_APLCA|nr:uncharacterized protein LOC101855019 isoform X2 [Aplysia californica]
MGTCYSRNVADAASRHGDPALRPRKRDSKREKKRLKEYDVVPNTEEPVVSGQIDESVVSASSPQVEKMPCVLTPPDVASTKEVEPSLHVGEQGVAPSDSGIESLGTLVEENILRQTDGVSRGQSSLAKRLERLSRGSCHKCGNFKLDDSALTALLADTYCLCGPRQAGKPTVNPQCQTHGLYRSKRSPSESVSSPSSPQRVLFEFASTASLDAAPLKSSLKTSGSTSARDRSVRISVRSTESLEEALAAVLVRDGSRSPSEEKAPLAQGESSDNVLLSRSSLRSKGLGASSRSLLTEILDITDSICKCDFYSNEYCCTNGVHSNGDTADRRFLTSENGESCGDPFSDTVNGKNMCSQSNGGSAGNLANDAKDSQQSSPLHNGLCTESPSRGDAAYKKCASLPKNVSFATESESQLSSKFFSPSKPLSKGKAMLPNGLPESSVSDTSSGVFTNHSASESYLASAFKDSHKRSASLGSRGLILSDSSSEALDGPTDDDLDSADLDSLSRVTSLSYSSIRQLVESSEELCSPLARRMLLDGEECVVMPAEAYDQMRADLAILRQQLGMLSSLMLEVCPQAGGGRDGS